MLNIQKEKSEIASLMFKHVIGSRSVPGRGGGGDCPACTLSLCAFTFTHVHTAEGLCSEEPFPRVPFYVQPGSGSSSSSYDLRDPFWI